MQQTKSNKEVRTPLSRTPPGDMPWSPASALPSELVSMVLDHVTLHDLIQLGRVCRQWRRAARAHPTFWRDITLWASTKKDLAFFNAQLYSTTNVGVRILVFLTAFEGSAHAAVRKSVLDAITRNLFRTSSLHLDIGSLLAAETLAALRKPAPLLKRLILGGLCLRTPASRIPVNMLAGYCPLLARVQLTGLLLPMQPCGAFAHVKRLQYCITEQASPSTTLIDHFPALEVLGIYSAGACDEKTLIAHLKPAPALHSLDIQSDNDDLHAVFAACPRLLSIPTIQFTYNKGAIDHLARSLPGPLGLELSASMNIIFTVVSHSRGWRRTCTISPPERPRRTYLPGPDFYACKAIGHRITTLTLDLGSCSMCYRIASLIGGLPSCETLELRVDRFLFAPEAPIGSPIPLPALTKVVIQPIPGEVSVTVCSKTLALFLEDLIGRQSPRLPLELARISLSGDYTQLESDYIFLADFLL